MAQTVNSSPELAKLWLTSQEMKRDHPELYRLRKTGLSGLDKIIGGGIEPGQMVVIGGAQKSGKTTLMSVIAENFAKQKLNVLYLSGEMTNIQTANLFFSRMARINRTRIRASELDQYDWEKLRRVAETFSTFGIWWNHGFATVQDIFEISDQVEKENKIILDAIFVDYLQLMEAPNIKGGRTSEIEFISRNLKRRSINHQYPTIMMIASQIGRASIRSNMLDANSFLGSGSIERDMDIGMIIHPAFNPISNQEIPNQKIISVVGSRETGIDNCTAIYNGSIALIESLEDDINQCNIGDLPL